MNKSTRYSLEARERAVHLYVYVADLVQAEEIIRITHEPRS